MSHHTRNKITAHPVANTKNSDQNVYPWKTHNGTAEEEKRHRDFFFSWTWRLVCLQYFHFWSKNFGLGYRWKLIYDSAAAEEKKYRETKQVKQELDWSPGLWEWGSGEAWELVLSFYLVVEVITLRYGSRERGGLLLASPRNHSLPGRHKTWRGGWRWESWEKEKTEVL